MTRKTSRKTAKKAPHEKAGAKPVKRARAGAKATTARTTTTRPPPRKASTPRLLSGGNPQIPMGEGAAPVRAYIAAMPGWKRAVGRRLDKIIVGALPGVRKAVKWNSPFYGSDERGWFLSFHCFEKYVKVAFFNGAALRPVPPETSKQKDVRYLDIREGDTIDAAQFAAWVRQASELPGWDGR